MHDFTPLCEIVTVGYQLNDGTHVHANSPFVDHKLSWKAAILVQQRTAGKRGLIEGMMEGLKKERGVEGGLQTGRDSCRIQIVIIWHKPDMALNHFLQAKRKQNGYCQKTHRNQLDMKREIKYCNVIWVVANLRHVISIVKKPAGGSPVIKEEMRDMIATERYKKWICSTGVSEWYIDGGRMKEKKTERDKQKS